MILRLKSTHAVLKTKDKYCTEDIQIIVDESVTNGQVNNLKALLDATKSARYLFSGYQGESIEGLINYSDTENVEKFNYMFQRCSNLTSVPQIDTSNGTDFSSMFYSCSNLTTIPPLYTSLGTTFTSMFNSCKSLTEIPQLDTSNGTNFVQMFYNCEKLSKIDISHYNLKSTSNGGNTFSSCYKLKAVIIRSFGASYVLNSNAFDSSYRMLGITNETYNPEGLHDGYVYVPRDMIETLQAATNWSTLQFRALEDYTLDGTTTGEFDDAKAGLV